MYYNAHAQFNFYIVFLCNGIYNIALLSAVTEKRVSAAEAHKIYIFPPCAEEFFETTESLLLKFLTHILHILSYILDLNQVKILFLTIFCCCKKQ